MNVRMNGRSFVVALLFSTVASAATWQQLPLAPDVHKIDPRYVAENFGRLHPWRPGMALPRNFQDAGLTPPVKLVFNAVHFDGGSHVYLFQGSNYKYLMFCTDAAFYSGKGGARVELDRPQLFLTPAHFTDKNKVAVPLDSLTERFLLAAIKSEVDRSVAGRQPSKSVDQRPRS